MSDAWLGQPDPRLGRALREVLEGDDHPAFTAAVLARLGRGGIWDILAGWAQPRVAAALLLLAALGYWAGAGGLARPSDPVAALSAAGQPLDREALDLAILGTSR